MDRWKARQANSAEDTTIADVEKFVKGQRKYYGLTDSEGNPIKGRPVKGNGDLSYDDWKDPKKRVGKDIWQPSEKDKQSAIDTAETRRQEKAAEAKRKNGVPDDALDVDGKGKKAAVIDGCKKAGILAALLTLWHGGTPAQAAENGGKAMLPGYGEIQDYKEGGPGQVAAGIATGAPGFIMAVVAPEVNTSKDLWADVKRFVGRLGSMSSPDTSK